MGADGGRVVVAYTEGIFFAGVCITHAFMVRSSFMNAPCGEPMDPVQEGDSLVNIIEQMGFGQKCVQAAESAANTFSATASASFGASGMGGLFNMSGSAAASTASTDFESSMYSSGCGTVMANIQETMSCIQQLSCAVNSNVNESVVQVTSGMSITVEVPTINNPALDRAIEHNAKLLKMESENRRKLNRDLLFAKTDRQKRLLKRALELSHETSAQLIKNGPGKRLGVATLTDTTVEITGEMVVRNCVSGDIDLESDIVQQTKDVATACAKQALDKETGYAALPLEVESLVKQRVERNELMDTRNIVETVQTSRMEAGTQIDIVISAPLYLNLGNAHIGGDTGLDVCASALTSAGLQAGMEVSRVHHRPALENDMELSAEGVEALQEALGQTTAGNIGAHFDGHAALVRAQGFANMAGTVGMVVLVIVVGIVFQSFLSADG